MAGIEDMKALTEAFSEYRDMLVPVQESLKSMVETYDSLHEDMAKLEGEFGNDIHVKLDKIYDTIAGQARKSEDLNKSIDSFLKNSDRYSSQIMGAVKAIEEVQKHLSTLNEIENKAQEQLQKLDSIIEEKKINYNIKELQRSLESYNNNAQKLSEFINKDVAEALRKNSGEIENIKKANQAIEDKMDDERKDIAQILNEVKTSNELIKKSVENADVNEAYIYDILDKWAESRHIKIKK